MTQDKWISVNDQMPADEQEVLVFGRYGSAEYFDIIAFDDDEFWPSDEITHWQPLPHRPETNHETR